MESSFLKILEKRGSKYLFIEMFMKVRGLGAFSFVYFCGLMFLYLPDLVSIYQIVYCEATYNFDVIKP